MPQRLDPQSYTRHFQTASHHLRNQQPIQAQQHFTKALIANPISYSAYLNLAALAYHNAKFAHTISLCDLAIQCKPYFSEGYYNRCLALLKMKNQECQKQAENDIKCAISCVCLQIFKVSLDFQWLQRSIQLSDNNNEAKWLMRLNPKYCTNQPNPVQTYKIKVPNLKDKRKFDILNIAHENSLFRLNAAHRCANKDRCKFIEDYCLEYRQLLNLLGTNDISKMKISKKQKPIISKSDGLTLQKTVQMQISEPNEQDNSQKATVINKQSQIIGEEMEQIFDRINFQPIKITPMHQSHCLGDISNKLLSIPRPARSKRKNLSETLRSFKSDIGDQNRFKTTHFCHHSTCLKCNSHHPKNQQIQANLKIHLKTVQIFRNSKYLHPKPYLIIKQNGKTHRTQVDYEGSHFPKWSQPLYIQLDNHENQHIFTIELWHKDREDTFLGSAHLNYQNGRNKVELKLDGKKIGYLFINFQNMK